MTGDESLPDADAAACRGATEVARVFGITLPDWKLSLESCLDTLSAGNKAGS